MTPIIDAEVVKDFLRYDPNSGKLYWKERGPNLFYDGRAMKIWNTQNAGKEAGSPSNVSGVQVGICGKLFLAHRLAWVLMTGEWPEHEIDHINLDRIDNRWVNLRKATRAQNGANKRIRKDSQVGLKGVTLHKSTGIWMARLRGKLIGYYKCPVAAHFAYVIAAEKHYGEYARAA